MAKAKIALKDIVARLWRGGERARAVSLAVAKKVKEADWPEGMAAFKRRNNL